MYCSVPAPMCTASNAHHRPSLIIESTQLAVAHAVAGARASGRRYGALRHRLHAAGDDDLGVARLDHLVGEVDRVDAREAHLVDASSRARVIGMPAFDRGLARGDLALAGLEHLAHEHVVDLLGADAGRARARP